MVIIVLKLVGIVSYNSTGRIENINQNTLTYFSELQVTMNRYLINHQFVLNVTPCWSCNRTESKTFSLFGNIYWTDWMLE